MDRYLELLEIVNMARNYVETEQRGDFIELANLIRKYDEKRVDEFLDKNGKDFADLKND